MFPNPSSDYTVIKIIGLTDKAAGIKIFNDMGQLVQSKQMELIDHFIRLDLSGFKTGIYFVRVSSKDINATLKLIINDIN